MTGVIKSLIGGKLFGFIRSGNSEYFFHKSDFQGDWTELELDYNMLGPKVIEVSFEIVESTRGPRAANVNRVES